VRGRWQLQASLLNVHAAREYAAIRTEDLDRLQDPRADLRDLSANFHSAYARELQAEHFVDEIALTADDGRNDFMERVRRNGETFVDANREHL
jgi:hypothetical protein